MTKLKTTQSKLETKIKKSLYVASVERSTETFARIISDITIRYDLKKVLDLGTGNGYIAIRLANEGKIVDASDVSGEALELATQNAIATHNQINFIKSDLFENIHNEYDIICFNPPCGEAGRLGMFLRNILKQLPFFEIVTLNLGYYLYKDFRLKLIERLLKDCRHNLKKDRGFIVLKLINMELQSMRQIFKENRFEILEEHAITKMTKAVVAKSTM